MGCTETREGKTYYLHKKGPLFFFSKKAAGNIALPSHLKVIKSKRTGMPMVKRK